MTTLQRMVPRIAFASNYFASAAAAVFYFYVLTCLVRAPQLFRLLANSSTRTHGVVVVAGLLAFYAAALLPRFLSPASARSVRSFTRRYRLQRFATLGLWLSAVLLFVALASPLLAPYSPVEQSPATAKLLAPSLEHPMGTDRFGRDLLSRVLFGASLSLGVAFVVAAFAAVLGLFLGAVAGFFGGVTDDIIMRMVDGLLAFPRLLLVLALLAFFPGSIWLAILILVVTGWMEIARVVRAEVMSLKRNEFVQAAAATGAHRFGILMRHIVPNAVAPVLISATLRIGTVILLEAYLSFLGVGVGPPTPSWGAMVFDGRDVLLSAWWVSAFPGLAIALAVIAYNLLGDGLRDALDVKSG